jgi:excisionase family DNA binding protein
MVVPLHHINIDKIFEPTGSIIHYQKNIQMEFILTTQEDLALIVQNAVYKALRMINPQEPEVKKKLSFPEAVSFLKNTGYSVGKSQLYKLTMDNALSFERFGRKIVFDRDKLQAWAEGRAKSNREQNPVTAAMAESAKRKLKRS